ncbi:MAG: tetratricopeptide repeat protein, partial [Geminicoccaceae bacterium]
AIQGHSGAQVNLAISYLRGDGVEQNETRARLLLEKASDQNDSRAFFGLALIHEQGRSVPVDLCHAIHLYQKSADLGFATANRSLDRIGTPLLCEGA